MRWRRRRMRFQPGSQDPEFSGITSSTRLFPKTGSDSDSLPWARLSPCWSDFQDKSDFPPNNNPLIWQKGCSFCFDPPLEHQLPFVLYNWQGFSWNVNKWKFFGFIFTEFSYNVMGEIIWQDYLADLPLWPVNKRLGNPKGALRAFSALLFSAEHLPTWYILLKGHQLCHVLRDTNYAMSLLCLHTLDFSKFAYTSYNILFLSPHASRQSKVLTVAFWFKRLWWLWMWYLQRVFFRNRWWLSNLRRATWMDKTYFFPGL